MVGRWRFSSIPTLLSESTILLSTSSLGSPMFRGPNATSSSTVEEKICSSGFWTTTHTDALNSLRASRE